MTQHRYSHYTYSITNKASIVLLCVLLVAGGSLFIRALLQPGEEWVLRVAWSIWTIAFVIGLFEYLILRYVVRQP